MFNSNIVAMYIFINVRNLKENRKLQYYVQSKEV